MIGFVLHKKKYLGALISENIDNSISVDYEFFCNNNSKQESLFKEKNGECVSNSNQFNSQALFKLFHSYIYGIVDKLRLEFSFGIYDVSKGMFFWS